MNRLSDLVKAYTSSTEIDGKKIIEYKILQYNKTISHYFIFNDKTEEVIKEELE